MDFLKADVAPTLKVDIPFVEASASSRITDYFNEEKLLEIEKYVYINKYMYKPAAYYFILFSWLISTVLEKHHSGWVLKDPYTTNSKGFSKAATIDDVFFQLHQRAKRGYSERYTMIQVRI